jgi:peroxiredoxin
MRFADLLCLMLLFGFLGGCDNTADDLAPSGEDKRPTVEEGITGPSVGQLAQDFTLPDSLGNSATLSSVLASARGAVLYFTMWCPICDVHMSNMRSAVAPLYPDVRFFLIDYVSGSAADARNAEVSNGYAGSGLTVLADTNQAVLGAYAATMGTTVVIDASGVILMSEDYKDGARLLEVLGGLP